MNIKSIFKESMFVTILLLLNRVPLLSLRRSRFGFRSFLAGTLSVCRGLERIYLGTDLSSRTRRPALVRQQTIILRDYFSNSLGKG